MMNFSHLTLLEEQQQQQQAALSTCDKHANESCCGRDGKNKTQRERRRRRREKSVPVDD